MLKAENKSELHGNLLAKSVDFFNNNIIVFFCIIAISIPILLLILYVKFYSLHIVFMDDWEFVNYIEKYYLGTLSIGDLASQQNEHRILFPRIVYLVDVVGFHFDTHYMCYLSLTFLIAVMLIVFKCFYNLNQNIKIWMLLLEFIPVSIILFTFKQWESILYGSSVCTYMTIFGMIAAFYLLSRLKGLDLTFFGATAFGVFSSWSFFAGLLIWPLGLAYIFISEIKNKVKIGICWSIIGLLNILIYFDGWTRPGYHPSPFYILSHPTNAVAYMLINIGSYFSTMNNIYDAMFFGFLLLLMLFFISYIIVKNGLVNKYSMWIMFILMSLCTTVILVIGRSGFGVAQALSSRYVIFSLFLLIGIYLIMIDILNNKKINNIKFVKILHVVFIITIIYASIINLNYGLMIGHEWENLNSNGADVLSQYQSMTDKQLEILYPSATVLKERIPILEKHKLNVFYNLNSD